MTSLREEITKCLQSYLLPEYDEPDTFTPEITFEMCDAIVRIFEQKIDELLYNYQQILHKDNDNDYTRGCVHTYKELKEELTKK